MKRQLLPSEKRQAARLRRLRAGLRYGVAGASLVASTAIATAAQAAPTLMDGLPRTLNSLGLSADVTEHTLSLYLLGALGLAALSFGVTIIALGASRRAR